MNIDLEALRRLAEEDPDAAKEMVKQYRKAMIILARQDPSWFCQYVLKDRDGGMIRQKQHHHDMHKLIMDNFRSVIWTFPAAGKTSQIAIGHVLWRLGKDPNKSFGILSKSGKEASKTIEALKCEAKGAKILLASGEWIEVQNLKDWTKVRTMDPVTWRFVDVTARSSFNGMVQCYQISLANGHKMLLTAEHPLYTHKDGQTGWTKAKDITPSHQVLAIREFDIDECTDPEEIPDEAAELLGYLLAGRKNSATGSIIVRDNNRSELWANRRQKFFERAGWGLERYGRWSLKVTPLHRFESPLDYTSQVVVYRGDWPVDLHPSVWRLDRERLKRLLSAFMSAAYLKPTTSGRKKVSKRKGFISGTTGFGKDRVPVIIEHPCFETLDMVRRLFMRVGVRAELSKQIRTAVNDHGIWRKPKDNLQRLYRLKISAVDVSRFFPTRDRRHTDQPSYYFERVTKVAKLPKFFETWAVEVKESQHSYISGGVVSHNTYIAESPELKDVFPHLKPGPKWASTSFTVDRTTIRRDPSVIAVGLTGQFLGARLDGIVIDDVDTSETVLTPELRDTTERVVRTKALTRLSEDGWAVAIGNVWHEDDLMHRLVKSGWKAKSLPVINPETGESNDPELFPLERIYAIRDEDNPTTFAQLYLLKARADGDERFRKEWIENALSKGANGNMFELIKPPEGLPRVPAGCRTITGVDLGVKKKANADPTAITTILEVPLGKRTEYTLLNIETGRWNAEEIMHKIREQQRLFASEVWVESNGCFVPGTRVLTDRGYKPIETIVPGTMVWTHEGRWRPVIRRIDGTARYVTPVHARGSLSVKCTPNHAFHVRRAGRTSGRGGGHHRPVEPKGWCSIGFPDVPLYLNVATPTWPDQEPIIQLTATKRLSARNIDVTEDLAIVLGLFMAEGHTASGQVCWTLNSSEGYIADFIRKTLGTVGIRSECYLRDTTLRVIAYSTQLSAALKIGKGPDKCLPLSWMGWPLSIRLALIRGWLLGDGSVGVNGDRRRNPSYHLSGCTVSRDWLMFVRSTLHQAGIPTSVAESSTRATSVIGERTVNRHPIFRLNLTQTGTEDIKRHMSLDIEERRWKVSCWDRIKAAHRTSCGSTVIQDDGCWAKMVPHDLEPTETYQYYDDGPVHNLVVEEDASYTVEDFVVHNAQDLLIQLMNMSGSSYKVNAFYTGRNKYDPMFGLESIAAEMATNCWTFPSYDGTIEGSMPEVQRLCEEMRQYMPGDHTGDILMSLWIAREGARMSRPKASQAVEFGRIRLRR